MKIPVFILFFTILVFNFFTLCLLNAQEKSVSAAVTEEPHRELSYIGLKLAELIERLGPPRAVSAARGNELWQDDVVFQYNEGDFFIYKDRVWQVKFSSAYGISLGDSKQAALLVMGEAAEDRGDHIVSPLQSKDWPLVIRVNLNGAGRVAAIFIYRPDF